jgi:hypothetical protein
MFIGLWDKILVMNWDSQILEWERPHFTSKEVDIILLNDICITETKNFALIEVNFQTRELLKKIHRSTLYGELFRGYVEKDNCIVRVLQNGDTSIHQVRN